MSKDSDNLEKLFLAQAFRNINKNFMCPHKDCDELGNHFRCYDLSFENCDIYLRFKQQYQRENNLKI